MNDINQENTDKIKTVPISSSNCNGKNTSLKSTLNINKNKCNDNNKNIKNDNENILKNNIKKEKDKFLRLFAEFENYKKRINKEKFDLFRIIHEELIKDFIPILDDFDRGLKELKRCEEKILVKGIVLIKEKFIKILKEKGLKKIKIKKGDKFNTDIHEAITQIDTTDNLKGKIIDFVENGYFLKDKVIRHAKVITGK